MKSGFKTDLSLKNHPTRERVWVITSPLIYYSELLHREIEIPENFYTDLSSVPRIPIVFLFWGGKAHREGVLHDYLYRMDSDPVVSYMMANSIFLEAMKMREKPFYIRYPMYTGVCVGGFSAYHKKWVTDKL